MELTYHLYCEDLKRISDLISKSDLLRENLIVETVGRHIINQIDECEASSEAADGDALGPTSTMEDNNVEDLAEVSRKIVFSKKPPTATKPAAFSVIK